MAADPRLGLAQKYALSGLYDDAWQTLQDLLPDTGGDIAAFRLAATIQIAREKYKSAVVFCRKALAVDASDHETQFNLALALEKTGELEPAAEVYRRALSLNNAQAVTWNNLGNVLDRLGRTSEAMDAYARALALNPNDAAVHSNMGVALLGQGHLSAARAAFERAIVADPANAGALVNLGVVAVELGDIQAGLQHFDEALTHDAHYRDAWDNKLFSAHYISDAPGELAATHAAWGRHYPASVVSAPDRGLSRKLRIGYVSPDFKRHSVAFFAEPLIAAHDAESFEVFCYSNSATEDLTTARFQKAANHWRNVAGLDTASAVDLIRHDQIDILVDLAGHTVGNRLDIFAARAAPVQVTALGYPNTTGLPNMDARLVDGTTDPSPHADAWATERLMRLPHLHCYAPVPDAPPVGPLPMLKNGFCTFGSFNKSAKISAHTVRLWAEVLTAVPKSRLMLKAKALGDATARAALLAAFSAVGVGPARLTLKGWSAADSDHLSLYNDVDIALDTYPYNGTTTTCEALWMGVPVITRMGQTHAARVGASLLTSVGLPDLIAHYDAGFTARAAACADDAQRLSALRAGLRAQMATSPLCQPHAYGASVEAVYRDLWAAFCAR